MSYSFAGVGYRRNCIYNISRYHTISPSCFLWLKVFVFKINYVLKVKLNVIIKIKPVFLASSIRQMSQSQFVFWANNFISIYVPFGSVLVQRNLGIGKNLRLFKLEMCILSLQSVVQKYLRSRCLLFLLFSFSVS